MSSVTLEQMLAARDSRVSRQQALLAAYDRPLLSFTLNIPGPIKDSPAIRRAFRCGLSRLDGLSLPLLCREERYSVTGPELLCAVDTDAAALKALCLSIEDEEPIGRLFDLDVIDRNGRKLSRPKERPCLVCGAPGRGCASRRVHSLAELREAVEWILCDKFLALDGTFIENLASQSLSDELDTSPKPGLVDRFHNGAHADMTCRHFEASIQALRPYWRRFFEAGAKSASFPPEESFRLLRHEGLMAERAMLAATGGVNTHKGSIFLLGAVCGAVGRLWSVDGLCRDPARIASECAAMSRMSLEEDFARIRSSGQGCTAGERIYLQHGLRGARGELADGLPGVVGCSLPALTAYLLDGRSRNDAGVGALLHLIARGTDTNMIRRGGLAAAQSAAEEAARLLRGGSLPPLSAVHALDRCFVSRNLSPGGCADLLSLSFFLYDLSRSGETV